MAKKKGQFFKSLKNFLKENLLGLSIALFIVSLIFFILSGAAWFLPEDKLSGGLQSFADAIGNWKYWIFLISAATLGISTYLIYSNAKKRSEFNELIETDSKQVFVKNLDDIEYLAFQLGPSYEEKVWDKKQSFKIK
jgi:hypothetical protein